MAKLNLTPQQSAAVENRGGSLLVSAAAGSGKTKVLVERLFRYITAEHCHVDDFLIITYTKAAAAELRSKISEELSRRLAETPGDRHLRSQLLRVYQADIKTVDAFCTALLRENTHLLAQDGEKHTLTPDFRVLDENDAALLRKRVLGRVLEAFYENMDAGAALLADTLGAGRDDSALENLVLETHEKLQSHASPEAWLERNRTAWTACTGDFDETPYADALLRQVRRKVHHWSQSLLKAASALALDPQKDDLYRGYGEKFIAAAESIAELETSNGWEETRQCLAAVTFPRLTTPKGMKDDAEVLRLKKLWEGAKGAMKKLGTMLDVSGQEAMEDLAAMAPAMLALLKLTADFSEAYRQEKLRMNCADFSDQEHLALRLLLSEEGAPTELGRQTAGRYREIMVDEYQDTNEVQNAIFQAVSREGQNLFTVGDVKQSIYRFRLADPTIFLDKYKRFASAETAKEGKERKILLSQNFRSRKEILDAANFVFANILSTEMGEMEYGEDEMLHFGAAYYPERTDCDTEFHLIAAHQRSEEETRPVKKLLAEARFTARRIRQLLDEGYPVTGEEGTLRPCRPEDIVILMRSPGSRSAVFAQALAEEDVPCSFEDSGDYFQSMEISVTVSLLEIIDNPRQDVPLISVLRSPIFGFTPDRLAEIRSCDREGDFYDALRADTGVDSQNFLQVLTQLRETAMDISVCQLLWHIYDRLALPGIFGAMEGGALRQENLMALSRYAEHFEANDYRGLFAFITQLRRLLDAGNAPAVKTTGGSGGVQMMSIHKSKGLEFPIVFLCDLDHSFSNQDFDTPVLVHPTLGLGPHCIDLKRKIRYPTMARLALEETLRRENLAEEQRVLYVAMTRPKEKLILVASMYHTEKRLQKLTAYAACPALPEAVAEGRCFGDWILLPLLCRPEAAPLRERAGVEVESLYTGDTSPWQVFIHDANDYGEAPKKEILQAENASGHTEFDPAVLNYRYPYQRETQLPAKLTATQLKGRALDEEIAEDALHTPYIRPLSQPKFRQQDRGLTPAERGTATHLVLQYLDLRNPNVPEQVAALRLRAKLTPEQAAAVDIRALERFLSSPLAEEMRRVAAMEREYRFTVLMDARDYDGMSVGGDEILLQGVVDCWFETPDGLTVVDFKTDRVFTEEELTERAELYRGQLSAYTLALERVLERPVTRRVLYFLSVGRAVEVS